MTPLDPGPTTPDDLGAVAALLPLMTEVVVERGATLFAQGDRHETMYLVREGALKVTRANRDERPTILAVVGPGEMLGEMALLDGRERGATVTAITRAHLLELEREVFDRELERDPAIAVALLQDLARRLRRSNDTVSDLAFADVPSRVARTVRHLASKFGTTTDEGHLRVEHQLTQEELAQLVGSARETVNKALASLSRRGVIEVRQRAITVIDQDALERLAG